ncbi:hypothetical protein FHU36_008576 [Nonomuraea muscovyensis]|uniref:Uncharacterized protein n=1 Tax=Nonomuraea muscovyensis TaxID=1124761 RepID=A0A7X0F1H7_9ACTN|nr:hypothetical protein [Nonomuraea muscovyensis]MBB6351993.1 hypothetical protein [Nonomuraea muscovyensis]
MNYTFIPLFTAGEPWPFDTKTVELGRTALLFDSVVANMGGAVEKTGSAVGTIDAGYTSPAKPPAFTRIRQQFDDETGVVAKANQAAQFAERFGYFALETDLTKRSINIAFWVSVTAAALGLVAVSSPFASLVVRLAAQMGSVRANMLMRRLLLAASRMGPVAAGGRGTVLAANAGSRYLHWEIATELPEEILEELASEKAQYDQIKAGLRDKWDWQRTKAILVGTVIGTAGGVWLGRHMSRFIDDLPGIRALNRMAGDRTGVLAAFQRYPGRMLATGLPNMFASPLASVVANKVVYGEWGDFTLQSMVGGFAAGAARTNTLSPFSMQAMGGAVRPINTLSSYAASVGTHLAGAGTTTATTAGGPDGFGPATSGDRPSPDGPRPTGPDSASAQQPAPQPVVPHQRATSDLSDPAVTNTRGGADPNQQRPPTGDQQRTPAADQQGPHRQAAPGQPSVAAQAERNGPAPASHASPAPAIPSAQQSSAPDQRATDQRNPDQAQAHGPANAQDQRQAPPPAQAHATQPHTQAQPQSQAQTARPQTAQPQTPSQSAQPQNMQVQGQTAPGADTVTTPAAVQNAQAAQDARAAAATVTAAADSTTLTGPPAQATSVGLTATDPAGTRIRAGSGRRSDYVLATARPVRRSREGRSRFVVKRRPAGTPRMTVGEVRAQFLTNADPSDIAGVIGWTWNADDAALVVHHTVLGDVHFRVQRPGRLMLRRHGPRLFRPLARTKVRAGTVERPHLLRPNKNVATDQLARVVVHEISDALQIQEARGNGVHTQRRLPVHRQGGHDYCAQSRHSEYNLLTRQLAAATDPARRAEIRHEIDLLLAELREQGHPLPPHRGREIIDRPFGEEPAAGDQAALTVAEVRAAFDTEVSPTDFGPTALAWSWVGDSTLRIGGQHFIVEAEPAGDQPHSRTLLRSGTLDNPHRIRLAPQRGTEQAARTVLRLVSSAFQAQTAPRTALAALTGHPDGRDASHNARQNDYRHLSRKFRSAKTEEERAALRAKLDDILASFAEGVSHQAGGQRLERLRALSEEPQARPAVPAPSPVEPQRPRSTDLNPDTRPPLPPGHDARALAALKNEFAYAIDPRDALRASQWAELRTRVNGVTVKERSSWYRYRSRLEVRSLHVRDEAGVTHPITEFTLLVRFAAHPGLSREGLLQQQSDALDAVDLYYNHQHRLRDGSQLHVRLEFVEAVGDEPAVTFYPDMPGRPNSESLYAGWGIALYAHELGHHLGYDDEYVEAAKWGHRTLADQEVTRDPSLMGTERLVWIRGTVLDLKGNPFPAPVGPRRRHLMMLSDMAENEEVTVRRRPGERGLMVRTTWQRRRLPVVTGAAVPGVPFADAYWSSPTAANTRLPDHVRVLLERFPAHGRVFFDHVLRLDRMGAAYREADLSDLARYHLDYTDALISMATVMYATTPEFPFRGSDLRRIRGLVEFVVSREGSAPRTYDIIRQVARAMGGGHRLTVWDLDGLARFVEWYQATGGRRFPGEQGAQALRRAASEVFGDVEGAKAVVKVAQLFASAATNSEQVALGPVGEHFAVVAATIGEVLSSRAPGQEITGGDLAGLVEDALRAANPTSADSVQTRAAGRPGLDPGATAHASETPIDPLTGTPGRGDARRTGRAGPSDGAVMFHSPPDAPNPRGWESGDAALQRGRQIAAEMGWSGLPDQRLRQLGEVEALYGDSRESFRARQAAESRLGGRRGLYETALRALNGWNTGVREALSERDHDRLTDALVHYAELMDVHLIEGQRLAREAGMRGLSVRELQAIGLLGLSFGMRADGVADPEMRGLVHERKLRPTLEAFLDLERKGAYAAMNLVYDSADRLRQYMDLTGDDRHRWVGEAVSRLALYPRGTWLDLGRLAEIGGPELFGGRLTPEGTTPLSALATTRELKRLADLYLAAVRDGFRPVLDAATPDQLAAALEQASSRGTGKAAEQDVQMPVGREDATMARGRKIAARLNWPALPDDEARWLGEMAEIFHTTGTAVSAEGHGARRAWQRATFKLGGERGFYNTALRALRQDDSWVRESLDGRDPEALADALVEYAEEIGLHLNTGRRLAARAGIHGLTEQELRAIGRLDMWVGFGQEGAAERAMDELVRDRGLRATLEAYLDLERKGWYTSVDRIDEAGLRLREYMDRTGDARRLWLGREVSRADSFPEDSAAYLGRLAEVAGAELLGGRLAPTKATPLSTLAAAEGRLQLIHLYLAAVRDGFRPVLDAATPDQLAAALEQATRRQEAPGTAGPEETPGERVPQDGPSLQTGPARTGTRSATAYDIERLLTGGYRVTGWLVRELSLAHELIEPLLWEAHERGQLVWEPEPGRPGTFTKEVARDLLKGVISQEPDRWLGEALALGLNLPGLDPDEAIALAWVQRAYGADIQAMEDLSRRLFDLADEAGLSYPPNVPRQVLDAIARGNEQGLIPLRPSRAQLELGLRLLAEAAGNTGDVQNTESTERAEDTGGIQNTEGTQTAEGEESAAAVSEPVTSEAGHTRVDERFASTGPATRQDVREWLPITEYDQLVRELQDLQAADPELIRRHAPGFGTRPEGVVMLRAFTAGHDAEINAAVSQGLRPGRDPIAGSVAEMWAAWRELPHLAGPVSYWLDLTPRELAERIAEPEAVLSEFTLVTAETEPPATSVPEGKVRVRFDFDVAGARELGPITRQAGLRQVLAAPGTRLRVTYVAAERRVVLSDGPATPPTNPPAAPPTAPWTAPQQPDTRPAVRGEASGDDRPVLLSFPRASDSWTREDMWKEADGWVASTEREGERLRLYRRLTGAIFDMHVADGVLHVLRSDGWSRVEQADGPRLRKVEQADLTAEMAARAQPRSGTYGYAGSLDGFYATVYAEPGRRSLRHGGADVIATLSAGHLISLHVGVGDEQLRTLLTPATALGTLTHPATGLKGIRVVNGWMEFTVLEDGSVVDAEVRPVDFTPELVGLQRTEVVSEPTGFTVGGVNDNGTIAGLDRFGDMGRAGIEQRLREAGLLGRTEDVRDVLVRDNTLVLGAGLTHHDLAQPLRLAAYVLRYVDQARIRFGGHEYDLRAVRRSGPAGNPFGPVTPDASIEVVNVTTGEKLTFDTVIAETAGSHGFYGGRRSPARVSPEQIIRVFAHLDDPLPDGHLGQLTSYADKDLERPSGEVVVAATHTPPGTRAPELPVLPEPIAVLPAGLRPLGGRFAGSDNVVVEFGDDGMRLFTRLGLRDEIAGIGVDRRSADEADIVVEYHTRPATRKRWSVGTRGTAEIVWSERDMRLVRPSERKLRALGFELLIDDGRLRIMRFTHGTTTVLAVLDGRRLTGLYSSVSFTPSQQRLFDAATIRSDAENALGLDVNGLAFDLKVQADSSRPGAPFENRLINSQWSSSSGSVYLDLPPASSGESGHAVSDEAAEIAQSVRQVTASPAHLPGFGQLGATPFWRGGPFVVLQRPDSGVVLYRQVTDATARPEDLREVHDDGAGLRIRAGADATTLAIAVDGQAEILYRTATPRVARLLGGSAEGVRMADTWLEWTIHPADSHVRNLVVHADPATIHAALDAASTGRLGDVRTLEGQLPYQLTQGWRSDVPGVLRHDDHLVQVEGVTHAQLAMPLRLIRFLDDELPGFDRVTIGGQEYEVRREMPLFPARSPFGDLLDYSPDYVVVHKASRAELRFPGRAGELIAAHGFYGDNTYMPRVDPQDIKVMFSSVLSSDAGISGLLPGTTTAAVPRLPGGGGRLGASPYWRGVSRLVKRTGVGDPVLYLKREIQLFHYSVRIVDVDATAEGGPALLAGSRTDDMYAFPMGDVRLPGEQRGSRRYPYGRWDQSLREQLEESGFHPIHDEDGLRILRYAWPDGEMLAVFVGDELDGFFSREQDHETEGDDTVGRAAEADGTLNRIDQLINVSWGDEA